ncbi:MAG: O-antigen ligase family protein [Oxalobacteraceae bacterium]|nr:O-antigen ligase family protein [Oxalobacteraceae bacterium]
MQRKIANICLFLTPACTFVFPGSYWLGALMFSSMGIWMIARRQVGISDTITALREIPMMWGFVIYTLLHTSLCIYHDEAAKHFGNVIPFLLSPLIFIAVSRNSPDPKNFWLGCATGALLAFAIGMYQVYVLNVDRAFGFRNPIMFGNTAIILGTGSLVGLIYCRSIYQDILSRLYLLVCGIAGLFASLLSGTKGGWLSLAMLVVMLSSAVTHSLHWVKRVLIAAVMLLTIAVIVVFIPKLPIVDRLLSAYHGAVMWLKTGEVTEASASIRLEAFKAGLIAGAQSPLLGPGHQGAREAVIEAAREGLISKEVVNGQVHDPHNDIISVFSKNGIIGVIAVLAAQIGIFLTFWAGRKDADSQLKALSMMGILLVLLYFEFGLTVSVFGTAIFRTIYISWAILLAALIFAQKRRLSTSGQTA